MTPRSPIDRRLTEESPASAEEARLAAVIRAHKQGPEPALPAEAMTRLERRLGEHPPRRPLFGARGRRTLFTAVVALAALEAAALVGWRAFCLWTTSPVAVGSAPGGTVPTQSARQPGPIAPAPPTLAPSSPPEPPHEAPSQAPWRSPARRAPRAHVIAERAPASPLALPTALPPPPAVAPAPPPSAARAAPPPAADELGAEAAILKLALEQKHAGKLQQAAQTLATYRAGYPHGLLWREAALSDLDVQLALGHADSARSLIERLGDDPSLPRSDDVRLLRAELAARAGHCDAALPVFEQPSSAALADRALYDRARCLETLGRFAESRQAFERYLAAYPDGPLADEARRALRLPEKSSGGAP